jgi:hypothetical protein
MRATRSLSSLTVYPSIKGALPVRAVNDLVSRNQPEPGLRNSISGGSQ